VGDLQNDDVYTKIEVNQETHGVNEIVDIFWLAPGVRYCVAVDFDQSAQGAHHYQCVTVDAGAEIPLNDGEPI
jgi:hypothetical protein